MKCLRYSDCVAAGAQCAFSSAVGCMSERKVMILELLRDEEAPSKTFGKLFVDGKYFGETLEDKDRDLEAGGEKVYGETAIPRGRYRVRVSMSRRFKREMPEVLDVPGFEGVRIHGGNTEEDTLGCPLLGQVRTATGVANCKGINDRLLLTLKAAEQRGEEIWLEVA